MKLTPISNIEVLGRFVSSLRSLLFTNFFFLIENKKENDIFNRKYKKKNNEMSKFEQLIFIKLVPQDSLFRLHSLDNLILDETTYDKQLF